MSGHRNKVVRVHYGTFTESFVHVSAAGYRTPKRNGVACFVFGVARLITKRTTIELCLA